MSQPETFCTKLIPAEQMIEFAQWFRDKPKYEICAETSPQEGYYRFKTGGELWEQFLKEQNEPIKT